MTSRMTKQSKYVLECFEENPEKHLTADEVSAILEKKNTAVSKATIYRRLEKFTESGIIRKYITSPDEPECYQLITEKGHCTEHFHLKCIECGELIHLSCDFLRQMEKHIFSEHKFTISSGKTVIYGRCSKCMQISGSATNECTSCHKH